jgi:hypothetical protein
MIRFMTFDPNGIGNKLHNCFPNRGAIAVRLRLNLALSPAFYEQSKQHGWRLLHIVMSGVIALDRNYEPATSSLHATDQAREAKARAAKAVSLKPNDWRFLDMSGYILLALGDTNVALEDFIAALRIKCRQLLRRPGKAKPSPGP